MHCWQRSVSPRLPSFPSIVRICWLSWPSSSSSLFPPSWRSATSLDSSKASYSRASLSSHFAPDSTSDIAQCSLCVTTLLQRVYEQFPSASHSPVFSPHRGTFFDSCIDTTFANQSIPYNRVVRTRAMSFCLTIPHYFHQGSLDLDVRRQNPYEDLPSFGVSPETSGLFYPKHLTSIH